MYYRIICLFCVSLLLFNACKKDEKKPTPPVSNYSGIPLVKTVYTHNLQPSYKTVDTARFEYDDENRCIKITSPHSYRKFTYQSDGNVLEQDYLKATSHQPERLASEIKYFIRHGFYADSAHLTNLDTAGNVTSKYVFVYDWTDTTHIIAELTEPATGKVWRRAHYLMQNGNLVEKLIYTPSNPPPEERYTYTNILNTATLRYPTFWGDNFAGNSVNLVDRVLIRASGIKRKYLFDNQNRVIASESGTRGYTYEYY